MARRGDEDDLMESDTDDINFNCPLYSWGKFFPDKPFNPSEHAEIVDTVQLIITHLEKLLQSPVLYEPLLKKELNTKVVCLNYHQLRKCLSESVIKALYDDPELTLSCFGLAVNQFIFEDDHLSKLLSKFLVKNHVTVRIDNYEPITHLKNLKSNLIGKFVSVRGTVIRVGNIKPLVTSLNFICTRCENTVTKHFVDGKFCTPTSCDSPNCKSRSFEVDRTSAKTIDWQKIRVQEMDDDQKGSGRIPRIVEIELYDELVDSCVPGDTVTVTGEIKVVNVEESRGRMPDKNKGVYLIYILANSIENNKQVDTGKSDLMTFSTKDMVVIQEISSENNLFKLIVNSICPSIYGHEMVKAGLALALFGGCQKFVAEKNKISVRGDPHVLVVGDPGLGKSQMLSAVSNLAPRGVFVCGSYASTTGLTVTMLKEKGSGDYALEAGALVLADQGCCCIDEFDKMQGEHQALLEAMEQQSISIAKAGIVCTLPARTSVIAAANPVGGHYNRAKTVCENLKMSTALLSRFDLIFILLDKPDAYMDQLLSDHVMSLHSSEGKKRKVSSDYLLLTSFELIEEGTQVISQIGAWRSDAVDPEAKPLAEWLKVHPKEIEPIPANLLRKYIGYARKYVSPKLSIEAANKLEEFYLTLREKHRSIDSTPVTTRQLESLVRLAEARAKIELREVVTEEDALDVIEIMKESLFETFEDEYGFVDFRRTNGMSKAKQATTFIAALTRVAESDCNTLFTVPELQKVAQNINLQVPNFKDFIESLNLQNYLLKKANNTYALYT